MKKFTESVSNISKVTPKNLVYFDLFPLLKGLEKERPGIKDRVWADMTDEWDVAFKPYNGRLSHINLFYYGIGDEYQSKYLKKYPDELEHSKKIHPNAFIEGTNEYELRLDFNLIWSTYEDDVDEDYMEMFYVLVSW